MVEFNYFEYYSSTLPHLLLHLSKHVDVDTFVWAFSVCVLIDFRLYFLFENVGFEFSFGGFHTE